MKKKEIKFWKMIGKNCKWNKVATTGMGSRVIGYNSFRRRKLYYCYFSTKRCGQNTECKCFDDKGKLRFERKENL